MTRRRDAWEGRCPPERLLARGGLQSVVAMLRFYGPRLVSGHDEIAERAYFIHLEQGSFDEFAHWLRAERELKAA